jgi:hypothetical protein
MLIFKTAGSTYEEAIRFMKHASVGEPKGWYQGEIILVSKNKVDCKPGEKQIAYWERLDQVRKADDSEIIKYWPGNEGRWKYLIDCSGMEFIPEPFDLVDLIGDGARDYRGIMTFGKIHADHEEKILGYLFQPQSNETDLIIHPEKYVEGACKTVTMNAYERDPKARAACIQHHGVACKVCGFTFGLHFPGVGDGFIHIHHIVPLANIGKAYVVDPVKDLVPVCPNCHAMLHRRNPVHSIEELQRIWNYQESR